MKQGNSLAAVLDAGNRKRTRQHCLQSREYRSGRVRPCFARPETPVRESKSVETATPVMRPGYCIEWQQLRGGLKT